MANADCRMEAAKLRLRLQMNQRLRLEVLAALSRVFREYRDPVTDDLLSSVVLAVPEELMGEAGLEMGRDECAKNPIPDGEPMPRIPVPIRPVPQTPTTPIPRIPVPIRPVPQTPTTPIPLVPVPLHKPIPNGWEEEAEQKAKPSKKRQVRRGEE